MAFRATGYGATSGSPALSTNEESSWRDTTSRFERSVKPRLENLNALSVNDKRALLKQLVQDWHALGVMSGSQMRGTPQANLRAAMSEGIAAVKSALAAECVDVGNVFVDFAPSASLVLSGDYSQAQFVQGGRFGYETRILSSLDPGVIKALSNVLGETGRLTKEGLETALTEASKKRLLPNANELEFKIEGAVERLAKYGQALDETLAQLSKHGVKLEGQALETFKTEVVHAYVAKTIDMPQHNIAPEFAAAAKKTANERWGLDAPARGFYVADFSSEVESAYRNAGRTLTHDESAALREGTNQLALMAGRSLDDLPGPQRAKEYERLCEQVAEALFGSL